MNQIFFTPGPTHLHRLVKTAMQQAFDSDVGSISHRTKEFEKIFEFTKNELVKLFNLPDSYQVFFISSGTEAWERIIQGGVQKKSLHYVNGAFSKRFSETALELGKTVENIEKELGLGFGSDEIAKSIDAELAALTLNETSTGVCLQDNFIEAFHKQHPNTLIAVDAVSAAPIPAIDLNQLDYYFFSVQKFFCMPAGLGVLFVSPRAIEKAKELQTGKQIIGSHHSLLSLQTFALKHQTPTTPNVLLIYILGKITEHFNSIGIESLRQDTEAKSKLFYSYLDQSKQLSAFVKNSDNRSKTVITVDAGLKTRQLMKDLAARGLIVGDGYGKLKDSQFRVANFSALQKADFEQLISALEQFK